MQVILNKDVKTLGKKGEIVTVNDGYAKNYLLPNKIASIANATNINLNNQAKASEAFKKQTEKEAAIALKKRIDGITLNFVLKCGEGGKLFGALTTKEIAEKLSERDIIISKQCLTAENIKTTGKFEVVAKLYPEITAKFYVMIDSAK